MPHDDHVKLTLDVAAIVLYEAAETEMLRLYGIAPLAGMLSPLEELGCLVLRALECQQAQEYVDEVRRISTTLTPLIMGYERG